MSLIVYQKQIDKILKRQFDPPYWHPLSQLARATEELGELARLLNHIYGDKPKKPAEAKQELGEEIADVIFTMICTANYHDIDLDQAMAGAIDKLQGRDKDRFAKKES